MARGKIMRDTNAGPGIVSLNGEQKPFTLEDHWRSDSPPKVGGVVDVEVDAEGQVTRVTMVDEATLAKEQVNKVVGIASEKGKQALGILLARVGASTLLAVVGLAISWLFLSAISVQISSGYGLSITFYDVLKLINIGGSLDGIGGLEQASAGFYGFLFLVVLIMPLTPHFHNNKYLSLSYCAPLAYMLVVALVVYWNIRQQVSQAKGLATVMGGPQGAVMAEQMMSQMMSMTMKAISLGMGFYFAIAISLYLAVIGAKKFLASTTTN
jgi:hypothetical protein